MKKLLIVTIGILLSGVLSAQVPFDVEKTIKVENGAEREVISEMTNVSFKLLSSLDHIKIVLENREFDFVFKSKKLDIVKYETPGEGIGGLTIYTCESKELGNVIIEEELYTMTGKIKFDRDRDGEYEEILVLHSLED
jgi:hypothetical protein